MPHCRLNCDVYNSAVGDVYKLRNYYRALARFTEAFKLLSTSIFAFSWTADGGIRDHQALNLGEDCAICFPFESSST